MTALERRVLIVAILASFVSFLDGSVVNVALPAIDHELGGGLVLQQWVVDAYLITLGSLILVAGSLSDVFGRKRVLLAGLVGFGVFSLACAFAPTGVVLVIARALQGVAGALLVPSSLALIISTFSGAGQAKAIGRWTAWTGTAMIAGPVLGGVFVDTLSWRWVFGINVLPIAVALVLLARLPDDEHRASAKVDVVGAVLGAVGLGGTVFGLIERGTYGIGSPAVLVPLIGGLAVLAVFFVWERRAPAPMLPLGLFRVRNFWVGNLSTALIYGALSLGPLVITLFLQQVAGFGATAAGLTFLPLTLLMLALSGTFGSLAGRLGARWFMFAGPIVSAAGVLLMLTIERDVDYWTMLLPGILVFGVGLSITVAPLTSAILGAIHPDQAGVASAVNNAVSRIAGLIAIAFLAVVVGGRLDVEGLHRTLLVMAVMLVAGGVISGLGIRNDAKPVKADVPAESVKAQES